MLGNVETPIFILAFCYTAVMVICLVFFGLLFFSVTGIIDYVDYQQKMASTNYCRVYQQQGLNRLYDNCVQSAIAYYEQHN